MKGTNLTPLQEELGSFYAWLTRRAAYLRQRQAASQQEINEKKHAQNSVPADSNLITSPTADSSASMNEDRS